jgi:hypothetical protein
MNLDLNNQIDGNSPNYLTVKIILLTKRFLNKSEQLA